MLSAVDDNFLALIQTQPILTRFYILFFSFTKSATKRFYLCQLPASEFKILVTLDDRSHLFVNGEPVLISRVNNSNS